LPVLPERPSMAVPVTSTPTPPDAVSRLLDEGTPDDIRAWLLQQQEVDQGLFAPAKDADPLHALAAPDPFTALPIPATPHPNLSTPITPDAPARPPVIRGTLANPFSVPDNTPTRLPLPPTLTSAPTSRGRRIAPSPEAKRYANTARLNKAAFASEISHAARRFRLDPALVRAVVHVESGFNPNARSGKGASGLMQLMPATARQWGVSAPHDAGQNITGGSQHLAHLLARYNGNTPLALAAYNAGEGVVDRYAGNHRLRGQSHDPLEPLSHPGQAPGDSPCVRRLFLRPPLNVSGWKRSGGGLSGHGISRSSLPRCVRCMKCWRVKERMRLTARCDPVSAFALSAPAI